jgi:DNA-binding protein H-NS
MISLLKEEDTRIPSISNSNLIGGFMSLLVGTSLTSESLNILNKDFNSIRENKCKEVIKKMQVKSRYEVIAELEEKKRENIRAKDGLPLVLQSKEKELKELKRKIEDKEEEIKQYKVSMAQEKITIEALIKSIDDSLKRFERLKDKEGS